MKKLILSFLLSCPFFGSAQIFVDNTQVGTSINDFFVGQGVFISNLTFNGLPLDSAYSQVGYFLSGSTGFPFDQGIIMGTGNVNLAAGPNNSGSATNNVGVAVDPNDPDLAFLCTPYATYNEAVLEFDFIPAGDSVVFDYIFASEEYHEWVNSGFNDVFAFFISGPGISGSYTNMAENIAIIPGTNLPVAIDNLNNGTTNTGPCTNCAYLVSNLGGTAVQYDGYTAVLSASSPVVCGETYHMKLAITDVSDWAFDSGIFFRGSSFISNGIGLSIGGAQAFTFLNTEVIEGCDSLGLFLQLPSWAIGTNPVVNITTAGNAIKDVDYTISDTTISFAMGDSIVPFFISGIADSFTELNDSILLTIHFLTPCGDTIGIDKVIHIKDHVPGSVSISDTTISCPGLPIVMVPDIVNGGTFNLTIWSTGDTSSMIYLNPLVDTSIIVQVYTGCVQQPYLSDTAYIEVLSDLTGVLSGPMLCYDDTLVNIYFNGIADSLSWPNDTLVVPFTGDLYYDLQIYDTVYGCVDSLTFQVFLFPTPSTPPPIYYNDGAIWADTNAQYQWYFEGNLVSGANALSLIPADTGYYYVEVWDSNGCSIVSDSFFVSSSIGLENLKDDSSQFLVYPNPSTGYFALKFPDENQNSTVVLYNLAGQIVFEQNTSGFEILIFSLEFLSSGTYTVSFVSDGHVVTQRLIIL